MIKEQRTVNNTYKALKIAKLFLEMKKSFTQVKVQWTDKHHDVQELREGQEIEINKLFKIKKILNIKEKKSAKF